MRDGEATSLGDRRSYAQDGEGLYLMVRNIRGTICKSWVFRYTVRKSAEGGHLAKSVNDKTYKRQHLIDLGAYAPADKTTGTVTLAEARAKAQAYRKLLQDGMDPLKHKRQEAAQEAPKTLTSVWTNSSRRTTGTPNARSRLSPRFGGTCRR